MLTGALAAAAGLAAVALVYGPLPAAGVLLGLWYFLD